MTLNEIVHMVIESVRENLIVDDERIDSRLVQDWINMKRAQFIKNSRTTNPNGRINLNLYQLQALAVEIADVTDAGDYPFSTSSVQDYQIVQSTTTIPTIIEDKGGPIIYSIESQDLVKLPFSVVDYDHLRVSGNGKFNSGFIFTAIRDNYVYFKYNEFFENYSNVNIRAIFEDPRKITGYNIETSRYPADLGLIEYVKNAIFDKDIAMIFRSESDDINDAEGEVQQTV